MKMENDIRAPVSGKVKEIKVSEGQAVEKGIPLIIIE
jgi:biotin carboxyl carrier protein